MNSQIIQERYEKSQILKNQILLQYLEIYFHPIVDKQPIERSFLKWIVIWNVENESEYESGGITVRINRKYES